MADKLTKIIKADKWGKSHKFFLNINPDAPKFTFSLKLKVHCGLTIWRVTRMIWPNGPFIMHSIFLKK